MAQRRERKGAKRRAHRPQRAARGRKGAQRRGRKGAQRRAHRAQRRASAQRRAHRAKRRAQHAARGRKTPSGSAPPMDAKLPSAEGAKAPSDAPTALNGAQVPSDAPTAPSGAQVPGDAPTAPSGAPSAGALPPAAAAAKIAPHATAARGSRGALGGALSSASAPIALCVRTLLHAIAHCARRRAPRFALMYVFSILEAHSILASEALCSLGSPPIKILKKTPRAKSRTDATDAPGSGRGGGRGGDERWQGGGVVNAKTKATVMFRRQRLAF